LAFAGGWKMLWKRPGAGKHTKVLISDGRQAIYEGRNIGEDYVEKWSDFGALLEGPVVGDLAREALHLLNTSDPYRWHGLRSRRKDRQRYAVKLSQLGRLIETSSVLRSSRLNNSAHKPAYFAAWDPLGDERTFIPQGTNRVTRALVDAIDQAQKTITLSTNFFFPSWGLRKKLKRAAQRGVQVNIVTTGKGHGPGYNLGRWIVSLFSRDLHKAGCRFFETRKKEHGKLYLFDEELAAFGSYNTSMMSHALNADSLLFSVESQVVNSVREALNESIDQSVLRD
jgi:phosphatidylserine/phosphatidylglycerophosphate/cardiolipin synthase-like enzyme